MFLVWQANVGLIDPDYHHPQLLELCELNQKRWESLTIPNQAPSGVLGELKKGAKRLGAAAQESAGSRRAHSKGILRSSITPTSAFWPSASSKKQTLKEVGVLVLPPTSRVLGVSPEVRSPNEHEVERLGLNRKKKRWRDGTAGIADRAIAEPGSTGVPDPSREHGNVERIPEVTPHRVQPHGGTSGEQLPDRTDHEGDTFA